MQRRKLGRTGEDVSIIGFGGIRLPQVSHDKAMSIILSAVELGINFFDSARGYGDSEQKIGNALRALRKNVLLCSKTQRFDGKGMAESIEQSLKNLRTDYIDFYLVHNLRTARHWDEATAPGGGLDAMRKAKELGKVRFLGFSCHRYHDSMRKGITCGEFDVVMLAYNVLNDELVDEEILPLAKKHNIGVVVMKPLGGGVLASLPEEVQKGTGGFSIGASEALRFVLANDAVSCAIPGMQRLSEVEQNAEVGRTFSEMSEEEKQRLKEKCEALGKDFCRSCGYCMPCPQGVLIPVILRHLAYFERYALQKWARGRYSMVEVKADQCVECGECVEKCPYELDIPELLRKAHSLLTA